MRFKGEILSVTVKILPPYVWYTFRVVGSDKPKEDDFIWWQTFKSKMHLHDGRVGYSVETVKGDQQ